MCIHRRIFLTSLISTLAELCYVWCFVKLLLNLIVNIYVWRRDLDVKCQYVRLWVRLDYNF